MSTNRRFLEMKNLEINSDKYTVLAVLLVLAFALLVAFSNVHGLLRHMPAAHQRWRLGDYVAAAMIVWVAVVSIRESKIRRAYPYGVAGVCLMAFSSLVIIALHWSGAVDDMYRVRDTMLAVMNVIGAGLVLFEVVRWFRCIVRPEETRPE